MIVTIKYVHPEMIATVREGIREGDLTKEELKEIVQGPINYETIATYASTKGSAEEAAEEAFDITNNPTRDKERFALIYRNRSLSVGDIVEVFDGTTTHTLLCEPVGWKELNFAAA